MNPGKIALVLGGYALIFATVTSCMTLLSIAAGIFLRQSHVEITSKRSFIMARRLGLRSALWRQLQPSRKSNLRRASRSLAKGAMSLVFVALTSFSAPCILMLLLSISLPGNLLRSSVADAFTYAALWLGIASCLLGTWLWVRGLAYTARPTVYHPVGVRPIQPPHGIRQEARDLLLINHYWLSQVPMAQIYGSLYPFLFIFLIALYLPQPAEPSQAPTVPDTTPPVISMLFLLLILTPVILPATLVGRRLTRRFAATQALADVCWILKEEAPSIKQEFPSAEIAADPEAPRRASLVATSDGLREVAALVDRRQRRGFAPHPTATVMRGVAEAIRTFLISPASFNRKLPQELSEILKLTLIALTGPRGSEAYEMLAVKTSAFDSGGNPTVALHVKPPGRIARFYGRATATTRSTTALIATIVGIALPIIGIVLALLGKIDPDAIP